MTITQEHKNHISESFRNMKDKNDFLVLLNYVKAIIYGEKYFPINLKQINYYSKQKFNSRNYINFSIKKKSGGVRVISAPRKSLKSIQACLNVVFQSVYSVNPSATGFVARRSIVDNAKVHSNSLYVYNIDLKDFFPSIDQARIWGRLHHPPFNFNQGNGRRTLANTIASLCCNEMEVERKNSNGDYEIVKKSVLPQGAPTSPVLSNIICQSLDYYLRAVAKRFKLKYTRYADDITFSSMHNVYHKDGDFVKEITRIITASSFRINESKTRLQRNGYRQEVTGLIVNKDPNVQRRYIKDLRMWLYYWEHYGYTKASSYFVPRYISDKGHLIKGQPNMGNVIRGKLDFLKMVKGSDNDLYMKLKGRFDALIKINKDNIETNSVQVNYKFSDRLRININPIDSAKGQIKLKRKIIIDKGANLPLEEFLENNEKEEKEIDLSKHKPIDVTRFLIHFANGKGLKFLTHEFHGVFEYSKIINNALKEFYALSTEFIIPPRLWARIDQFGFGDPNKSWYFNGKSYKLNWKSKELLNWINANPNIHPATELSPFRESMIIPFSKSYRIMAPKLYEIIKNKLAEKGMYTSFDFGINNDRLINLDKASFYTDVDSFSTGLSYLFNSINQRIGNSNKLKIEFSSKSDTDGRKRIIKIVHVGSVCNKPLDKNELFQGDLLEAEKAFFGICDWSIISKSPDDSVNTLNILFDINSGKSPKEKIDDSMIEGFTHVLTFYS